MKIKFRQLLICLLSISLMLGCFTVNAAEGDYIISAADDSFTVTVETVTANALRITAEGYISDEDTRIVSIIVLPETADNYTFNSVDVFSEALINGDLFDNIVFTYSAATSATQKFNFKFTVPKSGNYRIFIMGNGAVDMTPVAFTAKDIYTSLNEVAGNSSEFLNMLAANIYSSEATKLDKFKLLSDEEKQSVYNGVYDNAPFSDKTDFIIRIDTEIQKILDKLLADIKANSQNPIEIIKNNYEIIGVTKLDVYLNNLDTEARTGVDECLKAALSGFTTLDDCMIFFDSAVVAAETATINRVVGAVNGSQSGAALANVLQANKEYIGFNDAQLKYFDRLSNSKLNELCEKIIMLGDTNNDGMTNFSQYIDVLYCFGEAVNSVGMSALVLDMVNNRDNSDEIISIFSEYIEYLPELNMDGYNQLKSDDDTTYQNAAVEAFIRTSAAPSIADAVKNFNDAVANQTTLKSVIIAINNADFTEMKNIIRDNHALLGISADAYNDYLALSEKSSSKATDLINKIIKYAPYVDANDFATRFATYVDNANKGGTASPSGGGGVGGSSSGTRTPIATMSADMFETTKEVPTFTDLDSVEWAKEQILYLAEKEIINGKGNNLFDPNGYVTREEFVKMLVSAFAIYNAEAVAEFGDVGNGMWYDQYIASAYEYGIVNGDYEGNFGVGQNITREDMTVLVFRAMEERYGFEVEIEEYPLFDDDESISDYAKDGIYALRTEGYVNGTGNNMFNPKGMCTRAEAAVILYNVIK